MDYKYENLKVVLHGLFGSEEAADRWFNEPNFYFGLKTPFDVWVAGGQEDVVIFVGTAFLKKQAKKGFELNG